MGYSDRYELGELVLDGPARTFLATEITSGRPVLVHLLVGYHDYSALERFLRKVRWLQSAPRTNGSEGVLEVGEDAGSPYVVTEVLEQFEGLTPWIDEQCEQARTDVASQWSEQICRTLEAGDYEGAFSAVRTALEEFPESAELQQRESAILSLCRGMELFQQGRREEGAELLRQAYESEESNEPVRAAVVSGLLQRAQDVLETDWQESDHLVQAVLRLEPDHEQAQSFSRRINPKREELVSWCIEQVEELAARGDSQGAAAVLEQGLTAHPDDPRLAQLNEDLQHPGARTRKAAKKGAAKKGKDAAPGKGPLSTGLGLAGRASRSILGLLGSGLVSVGGKIAAKLGPRTEQKWRRLISRMPPLDSPALPAALGMLATLVVLSVGWMVWSQRVAGHVPAESYRTLVRSTPGALISIDDEACGTSVCDLELPEGVYEARAELAGYRTASVSFEVTRPAEEDGPAIANPVELTLDPLPPLLRLSSDLTGAKVTLDGESLGQLDDGDFEAELEGMAEGPHTLTISDRGGTATIRFEAPTGSAPRILEPVKTSSLKAVVVVTLGSQAFVHSDGEASLAQVDGRPRGKLGRDGLQVTDLTEGAHELLVGEGKDARKLAFDTGPVPALIAHFRSDRNVGGLRVVTGEDGAAVYLNGKKYRRKTQRGRLLVYLTPDTYKVRVEKEGFLPVEEKLAEVQKGELVAVSFSLEPEPQTSSLVVRNGESGAEVWLDDSVIGVVAANGSFAAPHVKPGAHRVSLRKKFFRSKVLERDFLAGGMVEIDGALSSTLGTLRIEIKPVEAAAHVTLRREGESVDRTIADAAVSLEEGTYTVTAAGEGYREYAATFRIAAGETRTAVVVLERLELEDIEPVLTLADWEQSRGWHWEGNLLARRGGKFVLAPRATGGGTYEFFVEVRRGRSLDWVINYVDDDNYDLFQISKENFRRTQVRNGEKLEPVKLRHPLGRNDYFQIRIDVSSDSIVHRTLYNDDWMIIDRWNHSGANFIRGKFGFSIPGRDEIALRSFSFRPAR